MIGAPVTARVIPFMNSLEDLFEAVDLTIELALTHLI
jgi:hypothetical protein